MHDYESHSLISKTQSLSEINLHMFTHAAESSV